MVRALADAVLIRRSGLFQAGYYRSQFYKELGADRLLLRLSPLLHYVFLGALAGKMPNPFFDSDYYRDHNPDTCRPDRNPLAHFIRFGAARRLNPCPSFDTRYYLARNPDVDGAGVNPLAHYLGSGRGKGLSPHPYFERLRRVPRPLAADIAEGRAWIRKGLGSASVAPARRPKRVDRIIRFEWDPGGWNNIRMQAEVLVCLAARFDRALVLPDPGRWYLVPGGDVHLFDFFEEAAFRAAVPVLPSGTRYEDEWEVPARLAAINTVRLKKAEYVRRQERRSWYFPRTARMFGCFAGVLGGDPRLYALVHGAFRVRRDLLDTATEMLQRHGLRPGGYLAVHVRRGDFQQKDMRHLSVADIVAALRRHGADAAGRLLIVSDAYDEALLGACRRQGWEAVCWAQRQTGDARHAGVLDMLCCCLAWRFVGTPLSTFSTGIIRWRGYVSRVAEAPIDAVPRFTAERRQVPWWAAVDELAWLSI